MPFFTHGTSDVPKDVQLGTKKIQKVQYFAGSYPTCRKEFELKTRGKTAVLTPSILAKQTTSWPNHAVLRKTAKSAALLSLVTANIAAQSTVPVTASRRSDTYACTRRRASSKNWRCISHYSHGMPKRLFTARLEFYGKFLFEYCPDLGGVPGSQAHLCEGMKACNQAAFNRNAAKLENERCIAPKV